MRNLSVFRIAGTLLGPLVSHTAQAGGVIVGVNSRQTCRGRRWLNN